MPHERRIAWLHDRDRAEIERVGIPQAARIGFRLQRDALSAVRRGAGWGDVRQIVRQAMEDLAPAVREGMLVAHLGGMVRAMEAIHDRAATLSLAKGGPHQEALRALQRRARLPASALDAIRSRYETNAARVLAGTTRAVEKRLQAALLRTTEAGEHVREGIKALREAFEAAGITPKGSFTLENLFRTQTQLAYGAGRWQAGQDEAVQEILWGYKYVTVGDDRVRPEHAALDGTTAPKDDPVWRRIWPPNGFSCRCSTIEVFEPRGIVLPPATVEIDGKPYSPGPDKGFAFNAGEWFGPRSSLPREEAAVPQANTIRRAELLARQFDLADRVSYQGISLEVANATNQAVHQALWEFPDLRQRTTILGAVSQWGNLAGKVAYQQAIDAGKPRSRAKAIQTRVQGTFAAKAREAGKQTTVFAHSFTLQEAGSRTTRGGGIVINEPLAAPEKAAELQKSLDDAVKSGLRPPGCNTVKSLIDHEIGHQIGGLRGLLAGEKIIDEQLRQFVTDNLGSVAEIERKIGRRASRSVRELLAEAWAEYRNSPAPRPEATWIGRLLERKGGLR